MMDTDKTAAELVARAIAELPEKVQLVYVDYRDELGAEQVGYLIGGDMDSLWESLWPWEGDARLDGVQYLLHDILGDEDTETVMYADEGAFDTFQEACWDRDTSDVLGDLIRNTPAAMVRYDLGHDVDAYPWTLEDDELDERARDMADAAGVDWETNRDAFRSLAIEAPYGGGLCVLHCTDLDDVQTVAHGGTVTFTDPYLLVYDGLNGSGHCEQVKGTVVVPIVKGETMRHDAGSYSWSDDIAGVVHSAHATDAAFAAKEDGSDA